MLFLINADDNVVSGRVEINHITVNLSILIRHYGPVLGFNSSTIYFFSNNITLWFGRDS